MKKRILVMFLSVLLVANISACNYVSKNDIESKIGAESTESSTTNVPSDTGNKVEDIVAETKPSRKTPDFINGVLDNDSEGTYTFNQNGEFSVYISDWDESHLFTSLTAADIAVAKYYALAIGVNDERAFLLLSWYYENKITIVSFDKGSTSETVANLDVDEDVYEISGNFINENTGYIFAFKEESGIHASGDSKLSNLFKTEDGGKIWESINVQNIPLLDLRNHIMFAKMISDDVGLISGKVGPADYDFCERTLLTIDGGLNWVNVNIPELPGNDNLHWAEVTDFTQMDNAYILTIRYETPEENYDYAKYKLIDLNSWMRIS